MSSIQMFFYGEEIFNGSLFTWGNADFGMLGNNESLNKFTPVTTFAGGNDWKQVSCGSRHMATIKTDGTLWTWGLGDLGQLGNAVSTGNRPTPVTTFAGGINWKQVSCGTFHTAAIKTDGTLWTWGYGSFGRLGNRETFNVDTPVTTFSGGTNWKQVSCGNRHTAAIKIDGTLWIWGDSNSGKLGNNNTTQSQFTPVTTFAGGTNWKQVSCSYFTTAAIKTDGTLWVWGNGPNGKLGNNQTTNRLTPVTTFAGGTNWKQVSTGSNHMAAVKIDGTLWTWGSGAYGLLGDNQTVNRLTPVTTFAGGNDWRQVSIGSNHVAAIKTDGTLWVWGNGTNGRLGNNQTTNRLTPVTTFAGGNSWRAASPGRLFSMAAIKQE